MAQSNQVSTLPPEIWRLVAKVFTRRKSLRDLYLFSRLSMEFANVGLRELYSIRYKIINERRFHSIFASCLGKTLFPYYLWITELDLNLLGHCILIKAWTPGCILYTHPLEALEVRNNVGGIDEMASIIKITNLLAESIRGACRDNRSNSLESLVVDGFWFSPSDVANWVSAFPRLTELRTGGPFALDGEVARVIRENCPVLTSVLIKGVNYRPNDCAHLAEFLQNLQPDSLTSFQMHSKPPIPAAAVKALSTHSRSLKVLEIQYLQRPAFASLSSLGDCRNLEGLYLHVEHRDFEPSWAAERHWLIDTMTEWLSNCADLRKLRLEGVPFCDEIVQNILKSPQVRLEVLSLLLENEITEEFCEALSLQTNLRNLTIRYPPGNTAGESHTEAVQMTFARAVARLQNLTRIDLKFPLAHAALEHIYQSIPSLRHVMLNLQSLDDRHIGALGGLTKLVTLGVMAETSTVTVDAVQRMLDTFAAHPDSDHNGIWIRLDSVHRNERFTWKKAVELQEFIRKHWGGSFDVVPNPRVGPDDGAGSLPYTHVPPPPESLA